jgi:hypothetical protein
MTPQMRIVVPLACQLGQLDKSPYIQFPVLPQENCWRWLASLSSICSASHQFPSILHQNFRPAFPKQNHGDEGSFFDQEQGEAAGGVR